mgnify:CR=1 FL=1
MTNRYNDWGVSFSVISFLEKTLSAHGNVLSVQRERDILFTIHRKNPSDFLKIICCDEYALGVSVVLRGLHEFGNINIFYVGGSWNGYTEEAKEYCIHSRIGLFNSKELHGAVWRSDYWLYHRKNEKGDPIFYYRNTRA